MRATQHQHIGPIRQQRLHEGPHQRLGPLAIQHPGLDPLDQPRTRTRDHPHPARMARHQFVEFLPA